jgi:hypothetical protein
MKFSHEFRDLSGKLVSTVKFELLVDDSILDVLEAFRSFLVAVTFSPEQVDKYIKGVWDEE